MKIFCEKSYEAMSRRAADIIAAQVRKSPRSVLGLATGSTPIGMYKRLVELYKMGELDFCGVKTVNLDEYVGLNPSNRQSYRYFMQKNLFDHINIDPSNTHVPDGTTDPEQECVRYNRIIGSLRKIDVQVLGIGHNGHIGFNEPGDAFVKDTHVVELQKSTIEANSRFFTRGETVPNKAITMGIRAIMQAKQVLLLISGEDKADIAYAALCGAVTPKVPASILQFHSNLVVVGDEAALSRFQK